MLKIAELTGDEDLKRRPNRFSKPFGAIITENPAGHTQTLCGLDFYLSDIKQIVVSGEPSSIQAKDALREIHGRFIPNKILVLSDGNSTEALKRLVEGKKPIGGVTTVYVCENYFCREPVTGVERLRSILSSSAT